ncbi:MAG TPA: NAD(P)-binding protein [Capillimicrobium sp.]|nr:NAD(P)-binding protein [Capillimicrobium sp.]
MPEPPFAITLQPGSSRANHTGGWRTERPEYVRRAAPCGTACPAGEDPQAWLYHAEEGDYEAAWRRIVADNPLPAVMGRVCYHPCQGACNRAQLDEAVGINAVERFLGDAAIAAGWTLDPPRAATGRRVVIVGAGPAGLSAAYHLARAGHAVEIHDAEERPGGMMRYGIPRYRLPRDVVDAEIERILALGVEVHLGSRVDDLEALMAEGRFDAAFVGVGAQLARRAYIPAGSAAHVLDAVSLLHSVEDGEPPLLGRRVAVVGGGNTAFDVARTARRLGATDAIVVYRRTRERMPAHAEEAEQAVEEDVTVRWLSTIDHVEGDRVAVERMELDEEGRVRPTGEIEELRADAVVLATGQACDLGLLERMRGVEVAEGRVRVGDGLMTGRPGVWCGGDVLGGEQTVTAAIGHGREAAAAIDGWLAGRHPSAGARGATAEPAAFDLLNTWYFGDAPHAVRPRLDHARRVSTFEEVVGGLDAETALYEARRCLSCGSCLACDNCYGLCPDAAVIKLEPGGAYAYAFDLDYCKGCGICARECPVGAIRMVPEDI